MATRTSAQRSTTTTHAAIDRDLAIAQDRGRAIGARSAAKARLRAKAERGSARAQGALAILEQGERLDQQMGIGSSLPDDRGGRIHVQPVITPTEARRRAGGAA